MEAVILTIDQYNDLLEQIKEIKSSITNKKKTPEEIFIDNPEFLALMKISKRTAQTWRDEGIISFSQIGGKIYYRMSDIQKLLEKNHKPSFK